MALTMEAESICCQIRILCQNQ